MACGTGACAAAVACHWTGRVDRSVTVRLDGGSLQIRWDRESNHVFMTGPAETVFEGEFYL
jgi:diaminopimelate epimerase